VGVSQLTSNDRHQRVDTATARRESARLREVRVLVHDRRQSSVGDRVERAMAAEQKAGHRAIDNQEYNV